MSSGAEELLRFYKAALSEAGRPDMADWLVIEGNEVMVTAPRIISLNDVRLIEKVKSLAKEMREARLQGGGLGPHG